MIKFLSILAKNIIQLVLFCLVTFLYFVFVPAILTSIYEVVFSGMSKEMLDNLSDWDRLRDFAITSLCWYGFTGILLVTFAQYKEANK